MSFEDTVNERFKDWFYYHPIILHGLIRAMKPQVVVEVGAYRGFGACWMARALQLNNTGKLYCIDNWSLHEHVEQYGDPRAHFLGNLEACGVREWVELIDGDSSEVEWPVRVDFCYVDGWHSYDQCWEDIQMAMDRGADVIAVDDVISCVGPRMAADRIRRFYKSHYCEWDFVDIHSDNGLFLMFRKKDKTPATFSQELPHPNPGVDLRPLTKAQQRVHFSEARKITGLDYSDILKHTEHA